jgi:hypothetical protein
MPICCLLWLTITKPARQSTTDMRSSGKQTIAFPYFVPDKQQKQIASGSHRIAAEKT